jgi:hypothetical protein
MFFRFDNRGGFYRRFRLRLLFNRLLLFGFLFCFLLFFTEAQPGKEATFFCFAICDYTPRGAIYMEAKKMMK